MAHARQTAVHLASHLLAAAAGHWVWTHRQAVGATAGGASLAAAQLVRSHLLWFTGAKPLGVKLHIQLAQALGRAGAAYFDVVVRLLTALPPELLELGATAAAVALPLLGAGRALAAAAAALSAAAAPLTLAYLAAAALYGKHLGATAGLWGAMRGRVPAPAFFAAPPPAQDPASPRSGKRRRPPPDPTLLAAAALLFMPFLLTLPTSAWFYAYFLGLHALTTGAALCLRLLGTAALPGGLPPALELARAAAAGRAVAVFPPKSYLSR